MLTVTGNNEGQAVMSYETSSDTEPWNIFGGSTNLSFSLSGSESLSLGSVTGTGTFTQGTFAETYQFQQGFFPAGFSTSSTTGTFTLTYDYTNGVAAVPEVSSITYLFSIVSLIGVGLHRRIRTTTAHS